VAAQVAAQLALVDLSQGSPCPDYPVKIQAAAVQFAPGFVQHLSTVDFAVPPRVTGYFAFCLDGALLEAGGGELDFRSGVARFNVSTTWVDLVWFRGQLDEYRDLRRWELRLVCDPRTRCGP
jgi:hypothetical protein